MTRVMSVLLAMLVFVSAPLLGAEQVKIIGSDFAFDVPGTLGAGTTSFVFQITGVMRHEMILIPLRQGVTEQDIRDAHHSVPLSSMPPHRISRRIDKTSPGIARCRARLALGAAYQKPP